MLPANSRLLERIILTWLVLRVISRNICRKMMAAIPAKEMVMAIPAAMANDNKIPITSIFCDRVKSNNRMVPGQGTNPVTNATEIRLLSELKTGSFA